MGIKANNQDDDVINDNPINFSLFNHGNNHGGFFPPRISGFMITEITEDFMITESGDFMITEF